MSLHPDTLRGVRWQLSRGYVSEATILAQSPLLARELGIEPPPTHDEVEEPDAPDLRWDGSWDRDAQEIFIRYAPDDWAEARPWLREHGVPDGSLARIKKRFF